MGTSLFAGEEEVIYSRPIFGLVGRWGFMHNIIHTDGDARNGGLNI